MDTVGPGPDSHPFHTTHLSAPRLTIIPLAIAQSFHRVDECHLAGCVDR